MLEREYYSRSQRSVENLGELYYRALGSNRPENLEIELEEKVDADQKRPYILRSEEGRGIKEMRDKRLQEVMVYRGRTLNVGRCSQNNDSNDQQNI
jgi:hypothetical protein